MMRRLVCSRTLIFGFLVFWAVSCASKDDQFFEPEEGNLRIVAAFLYKDQECGTGHAITLPLLFPARIDEIELCLAEILNRDCATWSQSDPTPPLCLSLQVDLE